MRPRGRKGARARAGRPRSGAFSPTAAPPRPPLCFVSAGPRRCDSHFRSWRLEGAGWGGAGEAVRGAEGRGARRGALGSRAPAGPGPPVSPFASPFLCCPLLACPPSAAVCSRRGRDEILTPPGFQRNVQNQSPRQLSVALSLHLSLSRTAPQLHQSHLLMYMVSVGVYFRNEEVREGENDGLM